LCRYAAAVKPATRLLYAESPANPTMRLTDLEALGALCLSLNAAGSRCERARLFFVSVSWPHAVVCAARRERRVGSVLG